MDCKKNFIRLFGGKANATQQNTSQRGKSPEGEEHDQSKTTTPKTLDNEVNPDQPTPIPDEPKKPVVNPPKTNIKPTGDYPILNLQNANSKTRASYEGELEIINNELWLHFKKPLKYKGDYIYIKCGEDEYRIPSTNTDLEYMLVKSILKKSKDGKYVNGNIVLVEGGIKHVKKMLELNNDGVVKVDSISNRAFEAPTLEQPNLNTTTTQQVVNNGSNTTIDQPKSPAVPNKSQGNSIVINGIVIPEGAKLKFFPEISDFLSRASLEREISFCKAPNSLLVQIREEQAASNDLSHKSQLL